jgi:hypothetical protein
MTLYVIGSFFPALAARDRVKPNLRNMNDHSATCSCSVELYKQWFTLADFFPNWDFPGVFSKYHYFVVRVSEAAMCGEHYIFLGCRIAHLG